MNRRELIAVGAAAAILPIKLSASTPGRRCEVVELRQYTLHGHRRDDMIALFEREFIKPQEAIGIRVIGQFRDLDDPDRFVWVRGFKTMESRAADLPAFYHGDVWKRHRDEANATILDSDNVLLLRPANGVFDPPEHRLLTQGEVMVGIHYLGQVDGDAFKAFFTSAMRPVIEAAGGDLFGDFVSADVPNNFPALPVRETERVFVWMARMNDPRATQSFFARLRSHSGWRDAAPEKCLPAFMRKPEILRLAPTEQSSLG